MLQKDYLFAKKKRVDRNLPSLYLSKCHPVAYAMPLSLCIEMI